MAPLKLLIVEDDIASLELMAEVFTSLQAEVRPVGDSREAVALIDDQKFDGIFLDLEMPNLHGFELARRIRSSSWNKTTPIVIVTGRDEGQTMQEAFAMGATFFLLKPVDRQKLSIQRSHSSRVVWEIVAPSRFFPNGSINHIPGAWPNLAPNQNPYCPCSSPAAS